MDGPGAQRNWLTSSGWFVAAASAAGGLAVSARIVWLRIFVTHDTLINYAHVWYVSRSLWHGGGVPLRMGVLSHGRAFAFPYAFIPWLTAAVARPALGDRVVSLWLVVGFVGAAVATLWAFPEVRRHWWSATVLVNPALITGVFLGQLPFLWAVSFLVLAVGAWRRGAKNAALVLAAAANLTHPAVVLPMTALTVIGWYWWERDRRALVSRFVLSVVISAPAIAVVLASPAFVDSSTTTKFANFMGTVSPRALAIAVPVALVVLSAVKRAWIAPAAFAAVATTTVILFVVLNAEFGWRGLSERPNTSLASFIDSPAFVRGATYRVLVADGKLGMYELIQHGARLDADFFPEDIQRRSFPSLANYRRFLMARHVDYVVISRGYELAARTNEGRLLEQTGRRIVGPTTYSVFAIDAMP